MWSCTVLSGCGEMRLVGQFTVPPLFLSLNWQPYLFYWGSTVNTWPLIQPIQVPNHNQSDVPHGTALVRMLSSLHQSFVGYTERSVMSTITVLLSLPMSEDGSRTLKAAQWSKVNYYGHTGVPIIINVLLFLLLLLPYSNLWGTSKDFQVAKPNNHSLTND